MSLGIGALVGSGIATDEGCRFVEDAADTIGKASYDVAARLSLETAPTGTERHSTSRIGADGTLE